MCRYIYISPWFVGLEKSLKKDVIAPDKELRPRFQGSIREYDLVLSLILGVELVYDF